MTFLLYVVRNLLARRAVVIPTVLAIAFAVAVTTGSLGLIEGLWNALYHSGPELNAVVVSNGAYDPSGSTLRVADLGMVKALPGIAKDTDGTELVSPELTLVYRVRTEGAFEYVIMRGVQANAFRLHPGVTVEGRFPANGEPGVVVGARRAEAMPGLKIGGMVRVGGQEWPITGILHAPGAVFDSEIWADLSALQTVFQRTDNISLVYLRLTDKSAIGPIQEALSHDKEAGLTAQLEREFNAQSYGEYAKPFTRAILVVTVLLTLAAIITSTNTLFTLFLGKLTEIGTLIAMGYTRLRVSMLLLLESFLVASVSGALGIALACLENGHETAFQSIQLVFQADVSGRVALAGAALTAVIGLAATAIIIIHAYRLNVLEALRS